MVFVEAETGEVGEEFKREPRDLYVGEKHEL